jgi:hypothetical protein
MLSRRERRIPLNHIAVHIPTENERFVHIQVLKTANKISIW